MTTETLAQPVQTQVQKPVTAECPLLDQRFAELKRSLVKPEHKQKVTESYHRVCDVLKNEAAFIEKTGPKIIPEIDFNDVLANGSSTYPEASLSESSIIDMLTEITRNLGGKLPQSFTDLVRERGCLILRNVVPEEQATSWETELTEYTKAHKSVGGFPRDNPQNWSLWWTRPQVQIRSHPRVLAAMSCVSHLWHVSNKDLPIDMDSQVVYPDRFRIRYPSKEAAYTLPAHLDSGAIERWEDKENRANFREIFEGNWQDWDGWSADHRIEAKSDLYGVEPGCSCWRSLQGWLSMSHTSTGEGTIRLLPSLKASVAYCMLRPLFHQGEEFDDSQPTFPGAKPGNTQFRPSREHHPHLELDKSMVGIPPVKPGDYVFWHCDLVHEVDRFHSGNRNSSVSYNACNPLTPYNIESLVHVREAFRQAVPPKDFASSASITERECEHEDHGAKEENILSAQGKQALGLSPFDAEEPGLMEGQRHVRMLANRRLGLA
ncbi:hypothetical protein JX265_010549 [Neoarthrinium moseri]|uniref:DUF1479-domain-containing protein n=1 Tax=Neoarthrinium moseri TaxID=1658444 RepID=A0A9P9WE47_9PEZI|nr:hypothetical protein JX265_010549 [Neoarthrinium moseri]